MDEFLKTEYEACLALLKYYDEKQLSFVKFSTGITTSVISLVFGFHAFGRASQPYFWPLTATVTGTADLGLLIVFIAMVQNRLYFIYPARQVNAIRSTMLTQVNEIFPNNQMYRDTEFGAFKWLSLQTLMNLLIALQVGLLAAFCRVAIAFSNNDTKLAICSSVATAVITTVLLFAFAATYLLVKSRYHPDEAIHGKRSTKK